jgi:hypothetical protein
MESLLQSKIKMCLRNNINEVASSNGSCDGSSVDEECVKQESSHGEEMADSVECSGSFRKNSKEANSKCKTFTIDNILGLDSGEDKSEGAKDWQASGLRQCVKPRPILMEGLSSVNGELIKGSKTQRLSVRNSKNSGNSSEFRI